MKLLTYETLVAYASAKLDGDRARAQILNQTLPTFAATLAACKQQAVAAGFTVQDPPETT